MNMRDLIPWNRGGSNQVQQSASQVPSTFRNDESPFLALHREMNRLFDDVFRGFDLMPFGSPALSGGWPHIEVVEDDRELRVCAELPGLEERDVEVLLEDRVLTIQGEKRAECEEHGRRFSERFYGRFMRQLPVGDVEEDHVQASFKHGVLTVTLLKTARTMERTRRIPINAKPALTKH